MDIESVIKELESMDIVNYTQTIYGDLGDYLRDMYMLSLHERQVVCERLIGKYVIKHIYEVKL